MADTKTCGHCQFKVPTRAKICGHCGAQFVAYHDTSPAARITTGIRFAFGGAFFGGIAGYFAHNASGWAIIAASVLGVVGFVSGDKGEGTRR
jgi:hypothetical protein